MATCEMKELRAEVYRPKEQPAQLDWSKDTWLLELEEEGTGSVRQGGTCVATCPLQIT